MTIQLPEHFHRDGFTPKELKFWAAANLTPEQFIAFYVMMADVLSDGVSIVTSRDLNTMLELVTL